jgi:hypothetical protein
MNQIEKLKTRQEKIDFLKALQEGKTSIKQFLPPLPPYGMVILDQVDGTDKYRLSNGRVMNETEFKEFLLPYSERNDMTIYGMIVK